MIQTLTESNKDIFRQAQDLIISDRALYDGATFTAASSPELMNYLQNHVEGEIKGELRSIIMDKMKIPGVLGTVYDISQSDLFSETRVSADNAKENAARQSVLYANYLDSVVSRGGINENNYARVVVAYSQLTSLYEVCGVAGLENMRGNLDKHTELLRQCAGNYGLIRLYTRLGGNNE